MCTIPKRPEQLIPQAPSQSAALAPKIQNSYQSWGMLSCKPPVGAAVGYKQREPS